MKVFKSESGKAAIYESYDRILGQWGIETEEIEIEGKYGKTHVITAGTHENPPLLLFHGVGDNSALMWVYNAAGLAGKFRLFAIDAIGGAGKSAPGPGYKNGLNQSEWVAELMDSLNIEKAAAAGVSYGNYIVQHLKMELPGRIGRIIGMAGGISVEGGKSNAVQMMKAFLPEALFPTDKNAIKLYRKLAGPESSMMTDNEELFTHWKLLLRNFNNMAISKHDPRKKFSKADYIRIKDESLFIIGNCDMLSYFPESIEILDELKMNYEIIENAGHTINHEFPELVNRKIIEFLD